MITFGSVCSGIDAASVAWNPLGWRCTFLSEIEDFPRAVLSHHYPDVPLHGDFTTIKVDQYERPNVLIAGTPCQAFSVAGLRKGMHDPRGNLARKFLEVVADYGPRWVVWENVPGCLSTHEGRDFASLVGGMVALGYGVCWRVLDVQYFGLAQQRKRVFLVGYIGDWRPAAAVLFDSGSMRGDSKPMQSGGEELTPSVARCAGTSGKGFATVPTRDVVGAITDGAHRGGCLNGQDVYTGRIMPVVAFNWANGGGYGNANDGLGIREDQSPPILRSHVPAVSFSENQSGDFRLSDIAGAIAGERHGKPRQGYQAMFDGYRVRRLTPREVERCFGFPDDYTAVPYKGKPASKCPFTLRYRALGNSIGVPILRWLGERIEMVESITGDDLPW